MTDTALNIPADPDTAAIPSRRRPSRGQVVLALALVAILAGWWWIHSSGRSVSTDNAYVRADATVVAPRVRGLVARVLVKDNQFVAAGTPLVELDEEEYAARLASAEADYRVAEADVAAAQAALGRQGAEAGLASANERTAATAIGASDAEASRALAERERQRALFARGFATRAQVEAADAAAARATSEAQHARAALAGRASESGVTGARRSELSAALARAEAVRERARAALDLARQDAGHSVIRAPVSGVVADRLVEAGEYVQPGTQLMRIVPDRGYYVVANFKETQIARMVTGQSATITIDALPGSELRGEVDSLAPGSGSEFALLPFEPGTGNFTKIVQRVPVRIRILPGQAQAERLRAGLSAEVTVSLGTTATRPAS